MRALGRILFVIFTFPAILHCDGWKLTISGARAFIRGDHLKTHNVELSGPTAALSPEGPAQTQGSASD